MTSGPSRHFVKRHEAMVAAGEAAVARVPIGLFGLHNIDELRDVDFDGLFAELTGDETAFAKVRAQADKNRKRIQRCFQIRAAIDVMEEGDSYVAGEDGIRIYFPGKVCNGGLSDGLRKCGVTDEDMEGFYFDEESGLHIFSLPEGKAELDMSTRRIHVARNGEVSLNGQVGLFGGRNLIKGTGLDHCEFGLSHCAGVEIVVPEGSEADPIVVVSPFLVREDDKFRIGKIPKYGSSSQGKLFG
ncbi:hypothetical protein HOG48_05295 [Candidatus Peregrinibacteria bacterium]|nr:hypothetical protein [Candidatus Peregrinibacteria bacterium]